jgi:hypothetical protein
MFKLTDIPSYQNIRHSDTSISAPMIEKFHHNPTKQKDQFIVAYISNLDQPHAVISYALYLAMMLHKGLILLHISDDKYTKLLPAEAEPRLQQLRDSLPPEADVTYVALKGETRKIISNLPVLIGAVALVCHVDARARRCHPQHPKELLRNFADCKVAYLTVQEPMRDPKGIQNVALSVDFKKQAKEKFIWSSYFARFNGSNIHALYYDYKDDALKRSWYDNMRFLQKLYTALNITFAPHVIPDKSTFEDVNALRYCSQEHYDLLISLTTDERDALEFFIGTQEQYIITNSQHLPILFLNPRDDLYVICD